MKSRNETFCDRVSVIAGMTTRRRIIYRTREYIYLRLLRYDSLLQNLYVACNSLVTDATHSHSFEKAVGTDFWSLFWNMMLLVFLLVALLGTAHCRPVVRNIRSAHGE